MRQLYAPQKGYFIVLRNCRHVGLMNTRFNIWTCMGKESGMQYAESFGMLVSSHNDGFQRFKDSFYALSSIPTTTEDARLDSKDTHLLYTDFKGAFNTPYHQIMFNHFREVDMPPGFLHICEIVYKASITA
jgi:hypothetical protein